MKTIKIKIGLVALILGVVIAFTQTAFKPAPQVLETEWTFMGNSSADVIDGFQYELSGTPPTACESGVDIPCKLSTPAEINTKQLLDDYILSQYSDSPSQVTAAADTRREAE
ncbi:MAG: hypothetical protein WKF68_13860 [Daejeonella sp.]